MLEPLILNPSPTRQKARRGEKDFCELVLESFFSHTTKACRGEKDFVSWFWNPSPFVGEGQG
jgi:hypothetical protein